MAGGLFPRYERMKLKCCLLQVDPDLYPIHFEKRDVMLLCDANPLGGNLIESADTPLHVSCNLSRKFCFARYYSVRYFVHVIIMKP